ncbi:MAG: PHP domain-containing protein [Clostridia bacterium]|nr:PHP domain-containing protein [Clostridia bacterium]
MTLLQDGRNITRGDYRPFDFHIHSDMSDGTDSPFDIVRIAADSGVEIISLTDHDNISGLSEARRAGKELNVTVINGVEIDTQFDCELHILGLGFDSENSALAKMLKNAEEARNYRNRLIIERLEKAGMPVSQYITEKENATITRLNIAKAIIACGKAEKFSEAFEKYLAKGKAGYVFVERTDKRSAIETIHEAGGIAVLAHPCKLKCDYRALIHTLADYGLDALEVYYPTADDGQIYEFLSLAKQYSLLVSSGSDYHGQNRKNTHIGCAYRAEECLNDFARMVIEKQSRCFV